MDIWALGTIFGEMLNHSTLFAGENDIDQIYRVIQTLGRPDEVDWPDVVTLPDYHKITFPPLTPIPFQRLLPNASPMSINLLSRMLVLNPLKRISAKEVGACASLKLESHNCNLLQYCSLC